MTAVIGYMVINVESPGVAWDGELHRDRDVAMAELAQALGNCREYGTGWVLVECHRADATETLF